MPGIFSSSITSNRPGLSSCRSLGKAEICRTRGFGSYIRSGKYSNETSRTESSYSIIGDSDRMFASIHIDGLRTQGSDDFSDNTSTTSESVSMNRTSISREFYSNKEHNAMIFAKTPDSNQNSKCYGRRQKQRQYQPSPSPSPCEWGYFVDTAWFFHSRQTPINMID